MKVRIDENVSYRVANAVKAVLANRTGLCVDHVLDHHPPGTSDPSWIRQFASDGGNAIISGDTRILQHWPDLVAYRESGLISFFPPPSFDKLKGYGMAAMVLLWWPAMVEKIKISERGDTWRWPMSWTPSVAGFEKLEDPRFRDRSHALTKACAPLSAGRQFRPEESHAEETDGP